jgi:hypothetical protein
MLGRLSWFSSTSKPQIKPSMTSTGRMTPKQPLMHYQQLDLSRGDGLEMLDSWCKFAPGRWSIPTVALKGDTVRSAL